MRRFAIALLLVGFGMGCGQGASEQAASSNEISAEELLSMSGDDVLILDVRTAKEYDAGHVPGAINISHDELAGRIDELEPYREDTDVIVYCERGGRAAKANATLTNAGFSSVLHLTGDMSGWRQAGHPMETKQEE